MFSFYWNTGIVIGYILASWMDYWLVPYVSLVLCFLFIFTFMWFPDSPDYLAHNHKKKEAESSYKFYELQRVEKKEDETQKITWADFKDPAVRRGMMISFAMIFFADVCGGFTITYYITELLDWANIQLDMYEVTVALGIVQVISCGVSVFCMDRFGRRMLLCISALLNSLAMAVFGLYYFMLNRNMLEPSENLQWWPIISLGVVILATFLAIGTAPFFLMAELLPLKLRARITTYAFSVSWLVAFSVIHSFHMLVDLMGVEGTYWTYGAFSMLAFFFVYFFLPETKNLSIDQIQNKLAAGKRY